MSQNTLSNHSSELLTEEPKRLQALCNDYRELGNHHNSLFLCGAHLELFLGFFPLSPPIFRRIIPWMSPLKGVSGFLTVKADFQEKALAEGRLSTLKSSILNTHIAAFNTRPLFQIRWRYLQSEPGAVCQTYHQFLRWMIFSHDGYIYGTTHCLPC